MMIQQRSNITLDGVVGRDPEIKTFASGSQIAEFTVARNKSHKDANGEWQTVVSWFNVKAFGYQAKRVTDYVKKGMHISLSGDMSIESFANASGQKVTKPVITLDQFFVFSPIDQKDENSTSSFQNNSTPQISNDVPF